MFTRIRAFGKATGRSVDLNTVELRSNIKTHVDVAKASYNQAKTEVVNNDNNELVEKLAAKLVTVTEKANTTALDALAKVVEKNQAKVAAATVNPAIVCPALEG